MLGDRRIVKAFSRGRTDGRMSKEKAETEVGPLLEQLLGGEPAGGCPGPRWAGGAEFECVLAYTPYDRTHLPRSARVIGNVNGTVATQPPSRRDLSRLR